MGWLNSLTKHAPSAWLTVALPNNICDARHVFGMGKGLRDKLETMLDKVGGGFLVKAEFKTTLNCYKTNSFDSGLTLFE